MSILRRITLILFGLLFMTIITVAVLVPQALISMSVTFDRLATPLRLLLVIGLDLVVIVLIYALVRRRRVVNQGGLVVKARGGAMLADVSTASARERVLRAVREVPSVVSAEAKLDAIDGKADIDMDVVVHGEHVNVPDKHKEIDHALRQVVLKELGLQLANRPRVHIRLQGQDELIAAEPVVVPVAPVVEPLPSAPPVPLATEVVTLPPAPVVYDLPDEDDENAEVTARYGLIGRRTEEVKAVTVIPPAPAPIEEVEAEPEFVGNWLNEDTSPVIVPAAETSSVEVEPSNDSFIYQWASEDVTPPAPVIAPDAEPPKAEEEASSSGFPLRWRSQDFAPVEPEAPESVEEAETLSVDEGLYRSGWLSEVDTPPAPVVEPESEPDDLFAPFDPDLTPPSATVDESTPIDRELDALDEVSESVETKGNLLVYSMPDFSDATIITPVPSAAPEPEEGSTSTPSSGLYDDNEGDRPDDTADSPPTPWRGG